jgi:hypothetical protein
LPVLARTLEAGPTGDLTFICGEKGRPLTKESHQLRNWKASSVGRAAEWPLFIQKEADRKRLARGAMPKLEKNDSGTSIPAPKAKVRASAPKCV